MLDAGPLQFRSICRNPRCRERLPRPTEQARQAFCCSGCFAVYFRARCLTCERPLPKSDRQQHKRYCSTRCKATFHRHPARSDPFLEGPARVGAGTYEVPPQVPILRALKLSSTAIEPFVNPGFSPTRPPGRSTSSAPRQARLDPELRRRIIATELPTIRNPKEG